MSYKKLGLVSLAGLALMLLQAGTATETLAAPCPAITVAKDMGIKGNYPQQFELAEFEKLAKCKLTFSGNPAASALNGQIVGNPALPSLADRLPAEPLVVAPYDEIGTYGGTLDMISNALEAGTSDLLSVRHVNLVRFSDDLVTIVPNIAKGWKWNDDFTQLTFFLRKGHKWSNGDPFTAADVKFWYDNLAMDTNVIAKPKDYVLVGGKPMTVDVIDDQTVRFNLPAPKPGLLAHFATSYAQGFQSKKFLGKFHPAINPDADKLAKAAGFENGYEVVNMYYGQSDWTDTPTPLLRAPEKIKNLPAAVMPSLESYVTIAESTEGRHYVANPYFHMVDTAGNQLPYIDEQDETMVSDDEVKILKMINGEIDYKLQSLALPMTPVLLDNAEKGKFSVDLRPEIALPVFGINVTHADPEKRKIFGDLRFRQAMSVAIDRNEINEVAYFDLGKAQQYVGFSPAPDFVSDEMKQYFAQFDPNLAKKLLDEVGLVDKNGDGMRDLPSGKKLVINLQFATQGIAAEVVELVAQHWTNVGVETTAKEVTTDEFRSAQSSNQLDVTMYRKAQPLAIVLGNSELFLPPFENYFAVRNGMLWAEYIDSDGASGIKPPDYVYQMIDDINAFQTKLAGTPESAAIGARLVKNMTENLLFIGTVLAPAPIFHRNALKNFSVFKTASYEYYRTYPYRAQQWFLTDKN
jgi:peptide/nickel transport system substrate-binding protein